MRLSRSSYFLFFPFDFRRKCNRRRLRNQNRASELFHNSRLRPFDEEEEELAAPKRIGRGNVGDRNMTRYVASLHDTLPLSTVNREVFFILLTGLWKTLRFSFSVFRSDAVRAKTVSLHSRKIAVREKLKGKKKKSILQCSEKQVGGPRKRRSRKLTASELPTSIFPIYQTSARTQYFRATKKPRYFSISRRH